jgi:hypothetical protein
MEASAGGKPEDGAAASKQSEVRQRQERDAAPAKYLLQAWLDE